MQQVFEQIENAINRLVKESSSDVYSFMHSQVIGQFKDAGSGGTARGVTWDFFSPLYTRKGGRMIKGKPYATSIIPAWGGVEKVQGKRKVKGRKRGKNRIKTNSKLMQDTGLLRQAIFSAQKITKTKLTMGTNVKYAKYQDSLRPFNFVTEEDSKQVTRLVEKRLWGLIKNG